MPTLIRSMDVELSDAETGKWYPPAAPYLEYFGLYGDGADLRRNLALGRHDIIEVGTVEPNDGFATFTANTNYLETRIVDAPRGTIITALKVPVSADNAHIVSAYSDDVDPHGSGLFFNGGSLRFYTDRGGNQQTTIADGVVGAWTLVAARWDGARQTVNDLGSGTTATSTGLTPCTLSTGSYRIGSPRWPNTVVSDIAMAAIWSRYISDDELDAFDAFITPVLAARGVAI